MKDWHHGRGKWCFFKPTKSWNAQTVPFYAVHFVPILTPFSDVKRPYYPVKCILHTTQPRRNFMRLERFKPSCVYGVPASGSLLNGRRWRLYTLSAQSGRKRSCHVYCAQLSFLCHTFFFFFKLYIVSLERTEATLRLSQKACDYSAVQMRVGSAFWLSPHDVWIRLCSRL